MPLPPQLRTQYLARFDELIKKGQEIYDSIEYSPDEGFHRRDLPDSGYILDWSALSTWAINYESLLDRVIPHNSLQRKLINANHRTSDDKIIVSEKISALKAIKEDFERGFLEDIALQIEAEIAADYMGQAEELLSEGQPGKFDHVPAAVLSGAILEKTLRSLCDKQTPPIPTINGNGKPHTLNPLIDEMKKAAIFNELKAKQLRAWADIRNAAAHGEFDKFTRSDVEQMIRGINDFLATYMT
jgi:hypothetical protein